MSRLAPAGPAAGRTAAGRPATPGAFRLGYRPWLDGLRGLAVLLVLACHLNLIPGGFLGVDVFFVLSGFLITALLVEEWQLRGSISLPRFYLRRALRLGPAFFTLLLICGLVSLFQPTEQAAALRREIAVAACYITNWRSLHGVRTPTLGHTWSLALEEQFYVVWPVLLWTMLRAGLRRSRILLLVCGGVVASAAWRAALCVWPKYPGRGWSEHIWRAYMNLDTRADALLVGCLVGLAAAWGLLPRSRRSLLALRVAAPVAAGILGYLVLHSGVTDPRLYRGLFTVTALLVALVLVRLLAAPSGLTSRVLASAPLVGAGRVSYALYLFHGPLLNALGVPRPGWSGPGQTLLAVGLSFAAAALSYYAVERPFLRLKRRLEPPVGAGARALSPDGPVRPRAVA